jgi:hypothetical protein
VAPSSSYLVDQANWLAGVTTPLSYTTTSRKEHCSRNLIWVQLSFIVPITVLFLKSMITISGALAPSSEVSLSPPFILCMSLSSTGRLVVGTADGHLWIGTGEEKRRGDKKKRTRKWEGLRKDDSIKTKIAEGPVVGVFVCLQRIL